MQASKVGLGETSEDTLDIFLEILEDSKEYLFDLKKICKREYPDFQHDIPPTSNIRITNCSRLAFGTDTCNQAYKARRLIIEKINEAEESKANNISKSNM